MADIWLANINVLASDFRVMAPDLLGCGFTGPPNFGNHTVIAAQVAHLANLVDILELDRFSVCGSSYGALVGTLLALQMPKRVHRLVISGSASAFLNSESLAAGLTRMHERGREAIFGGTDKDFWRRWLRHALFDPAKIPDSLLDKLVEVYAQPWIAPAWEKSILSFRDHDPSGPYRILHRLEDISTKTLVTWGREDRGAPLRTAEAAVARMPNAKLVVLEQCGHMMMLDNPELYNKTIREFLSR